MMDMSEFERLSKQLDEKERHELLEKIQKEKKERNPLEKNNLEGKKEKKFSYISPQFEMARKIYQKNDLFNKILIFLLAIFSGKKIEEVIINNLLLKLKKEIQSKYNNLVNFDSKRLTYHFAFEIMIISDLCTKLQPIVKNYFEFTEYFEKYLIIKFEDQFNANIKNEMDQLIPKDLNKNNTIVDKNTFIKERDRRIKNFFNQIDSVKFDKFILELKEIEILVKLIKFNYSDILKEFSIVTPNDKLSSTNFANFSNVEKILENFYSLINEINFNVWDNTLITELVDYSKNNPISEHINSSKLSFTTNELDKLTKLLEAINKFKEKIPLDKIFQYFKKDILYKPKPLQININFINNYKENKRKHTEEIWENYYLEMKKEDLYRLMSDILPDFNFNSLENFNIKVYNNILNLVGVKVTSVYYLNLFYYFLIRIYKTGIEQIINKFLVEGNFISESAKFHLSAAYHTLINDIEKIREFDAKFTYDQEYGKRIINFARISSSIISEPDIRKSFLNFVNEIKEQSNSIVNEINTSLNSINNFLLNIYDPAKKTDIPISNLENIKMHGGVNIVKYIEKYIPIFKRLFKIFMYIDNLY